MELKNNFSGDGVVYDLLKETFSNIILQISLALNNLKQAKQAAETEQN